MKTGTLIIKNRVVECCYECPMKSTDGGGPGPVMVCEHPLFDWARKVAENKGGYFSPYNAAILNNTEYRNGFPDLCPFFNGAAQV